MYVRTYVPKSKNLYLKLILDSYEYIPVAYETMYCMILPSLKIIAHFVATGNFLIRYSNGYMTSIHHQLNKCHDYF
jgi:hypothetical protein